LVVDLSKGSYRYGVHSNQQLDGNFLFLEFMVAYSYSLVGVCKLKPKPKPKPKPIFGIGFVPETTSLKTGF